MLEQKKLQISALMDGEETEISILTDIEEDSQLQSSWQRYHLVRQAISGKLHPSIVNVDVVDSVAAEIAKEQNYSQLPNQPEPITLGFAKEANRFWFKTKGFITKFGQLGLAACVTLAIISGFQYYQGYFNKNTNHTFNTIPMGVSLEPVGGIANKEQPDLDKIHYDKIRLLLQDYELQKRLNTH